MDTRIGSARVVSLSCPQLQEAVLVFIWLRGADDSVLMPNVGANRTGTAGQLGPAGAG
jgi:hypothetical protein